MNQRRFADQMENGLYLGKKYIENAKASNHKGLEERFAVPKLVYCHRFARHGILRALPKHGLRASNVSAFN